MYLGVWWNPFSWGQDFIDGIVSFFYGILLSIDCIIYSFVSYVYQIFLVLAQGADIFDDKIINGFVNRLYIILGVVMLFIIAYSLLKNMVNPDEALKGKKSPINIIKDVIISVVLIAIIPTIFDFAFAFQNSLLINNTIGKIIVGDGGSAKTTDSIRKGGYIMASGVFKAFLHAEHPYCDSKEQEIRGVYEDGELCNTLYVDNSDSTSYGDLWDEAYDSTTFWALARLGPSIVKGDVSYYFLIAPAAGVFVLFVLLSYCLDMALRLVKLAVYELIAPIPLFARMIPNDQAKKVFSNWVNATLSTFAEVFIRIAILYFSVMLISAATSSINDLFKPLVSGSARFDLLLFAQALIIIGIVLFVKQAPEIIKEITGLDSGKFNVLKSAKQGFAAVAGGIAGGTPAAAVRAWEETGKDGSLKSIGNQFKRRQAAKEAELMGATRRDRLNNRARGMLGFGTTKEAADYNLEHNRNLNGNYLTATNDTGSRILDIHGHELIADNATFELNEENIRKLNQAKAEYAIAKSEISEQARQKEDIDKANSVVKGFKGEMEQLAKDEMMKGKFRLRDASGGELWLAFADKEGKTQMLEGKTQKEFEAWLEANRENMQAEDYARLSKALQDSINVHSVEAFANLNGQDRPGGDINKDAVNIKERFHQRVQQTQVYNADGTVSADAILQSVRSTSTQDASTITWSQIKGVKDHVDDIHREVAKEIDMINVEKGKIDDSTTKIDRIIAQGEERKTEIKAGAEYQRREAAHKANKTEDSGK